MIIHLSQDLETAIGSLVRDGRFATLDDAMAEAARLLLREQPSAPKPVSPDEIDQMLLDLNLLSRVPDTAADFDDPEDQLVKIKGEPLSETIIRERR